MLRPNGITDLTASSVKKKMKAKGFARGVNRDDVIRGAAEFGVDLTEHIQFEIEAMKGIASDLGLERGAGGGMTDLPPRPLRRVLQPIEHFAGLRDVQNALVLAILIVRDVDRRRIAIAEVDRPADVLGDLRRQRHADARLLDAVLIGPDAADVGRMGQDAPRLVLEALPLAEEIIARVVADALG